MEAEIVEKETTETIKDSVVNLDEPITAGVDENYKENKVKIEKEYGEQWSFCKCIVANDSLDKVLKNGADVDDSFIARFDEVETKCKAFLTMSKNSTPEERSLHQEKITNCLKGAKK